ncbi:MAG: hypothetical protein ACTSRS_17735, partial [Candidatus Helarchaeota archaeon]
VEYPTQLIIFTDFKRSNFNERRIYPLVHREVMKVGLSRGIQELNTRMNPLIRQIEALWKALEDRDDELVRLMMNYDIERLKFIDQFRENLKVLLDKIRGK